MKSFRKISLVVVVLGMFGGVGDAFGEHISSSYTFFTQGKNVTEINTQFPAQKGLIEKGSEDEGIKQIGNYQVEVSSPKNYQEVCVEITKDGDKLEILTLNQPRRENFSARIPVYQQFYHEDSSNTHIYLIFPKDVAIIKELQRIGCIDENGREKHLVACHPDNTEISNLFRKFNAAAEGTIELMRDERMQLERAFDNAVDMIPGKIGKGIEVTKSAVKWVLWRDEEGRVKKLQKKYGKGYYIHKMPVYVPEGITLRYVHISRETVIHLDASGLTEGKKVFVEIPQITYEQNVPGAVRKASLEGLVFEVKVEPSGEKDDSSIESKKSTIRIISAPGKALLEDTSSLGAMFSFEVGGVMYIFSVKKDQERKDLMDIFLDFPNVLGTNNSQLDESFKGSGGIIDMGKVPIQEILIAPKSGYKPALSIDEVKEGHTYCVKASNGRNYGKIYILKFDHGGRPPFVEFNWEYQIKENVRKFDR